MKLRDLVVLRTKYHVKLAANMILIWESLEL